MESPQRSSSPIMASSPASPRGAEAFEPILTPRSKIRALMAQVDESDDDADDLPARPSRTVRQKSPLPDTQSSTAPDAISGPDHNDEDQDVPLPRGRLAARLRGTNDVQDTSAQQSSEEESAYERLKRELAQKEHAKEKSPEPEDEDEDEPVSQPVPMRRMLFTKKKPQAELSNSSRHGSDAEPVASNAPHNQEPGSPKSGSELPNLDDLLAGSDSDRALPRAHNERHNALVARKRAERKKREAEQERERERRRENLARSSDRLEELIDEDVDADKEDAHAGKKLTSQARPTRKASKKAIEEMNRETQRMTRNMQLAHAATTRKKFTKDDLFAKLKFRQPATVAPAPESSASSLPGTSRPTSDVEQEQEHNTPPTSPASPARSLNKDAAETQVEETDLESLPLGPAENTHVVTADGDDDELPTLDELLNAPLPSALPKINAKQTAKRSHAVKPMSEKAKGKQKADPLISLDAANAPPAKSRRAKVANFRVKLPSDIPVSLSDSESDLEIAPAKPLSRKFDAILAKAPQGMKQSNNKIKFRALAHLTSPSKRDRRYAKASVPAGQMQLDLQRKAREQIARDREERLDELRARGVIIQTAEERERDQMVTEDLLEKARKEVEELTRREKAERKKGENGDAGDAMDIDESDDESFVASGTDGEGADNVAGEDEEEAEPELSGSEEEDVEDEEEDEGVGLATDSMCDNEADEDGDDESEHTDEQEQQDQHEDDDDIDAISAALVPTRRNRVKRVIDDDDEDGKDTALRPTSIAVPGSEPTSPAVVNPFGNAAVANPFGAAPMGLTQAFAATMEDSQMDVDGFTQESTAVVVAMPEPNLPVVDQESVSREHGRLNLTSPAPALPSLPPTQFTQRMSLTQDFEMPDPTQDGGFLATSPIAQRFASVPPSTVDTVLVSQPADPGLRRKGRLLRRGEMSRVSEDEGEVSSAVPPASNSPPKALDAFTAMKKAEKRRQRIANFEKKKSAAKDIVDEQAEESEDEYAGLGGASDDESGGEMDEEVKKMLDDETQLDLNESQLAAFHANKERMSDEKAIEKLYKDINNGGLRRKRGNGDFDDDLDDSDDEAERRQRMKRAEFARMRKALLADENVGKIAENPKKAAFLKALEDREDTDDFGFLDEPEPAAALMREDSIQEVPNSQPQAAHSDADAQTTAEKRKRPLEEADPNKRLPPALRRTNPHLTGAKKPATLAEIRESVSFLVEDSRGSEILVPATQSDEEHDDEDLVAESRFAARRRANPVIDRLSLKRAESSNSNGSGGRVAFFTKGRDEQGFRVPSLLKKATSLSASGEVTYVTERTAGRKENEVKKGGTKKSSVAYFAREVERRKAVDKVEKRRQVERKKAVEGRRELLKGLGAGKFE